MEKHKLTWSLILINVATFLLVFSFPEPVRDWVFQTFSFSGGTSTEIWRWFTAMFLHANASHLFFNMLGLYFFGKILEEEVRKDWFLSIYFVSGLIGDFVYMFTSPEPVVGASGAIFGVMGAVMLLNPVKKIHLYLFPLPLGIIAITFAIFETIVVYFQPSLAPSNVANVAHLGGLLTGSIFAYFYEPKRAVKGTFVVFVCVLILILLAPFFTLISSIASFFLDFIEKIFGAILYTLASIIGLLWK